MEKAILKTLIYADIFDYPLNVFEIHKWLIGRKVELYKVEKAVDKLVQSVKCTVKSGYYFLPKRDELVIKRKGKEKQSKIFLKKAKIITYFLKVIPWIKLVGISGGLALNNASKKDDIDLFLITTKKRIWLVRLLTLGFLSLIGQRRKVNDKGPRIAGKICLNTLLEEDNLVQVNKDIYTAHEVLQMKVLWERDGIYSKYLLDNEWVFKFLPNWVSDVHGLVDLSSRRMSGSNKQNKVVNWIPAFAGMTMENMAKRFQLWYMKKPAGRERITEGALYFHPNDIRTQILDKFSLKVKNLSTT